MLQESLLLLRSNGKNPRLLVADEEKKKGINCSKHTQLLKTIL